MLTVGEMVRAARSAWSWWRTLPLSGNDGARTVDRGATSSRWLPLACLGETVRTAVGSARSWWRTLPLSEDRCGSKCRSWDRKELALARLWNERTYSAESADRCTVRLGSGVLSPGGLLRSGSGGWHEAC